MHIPDGYLGPETLAVGWAITLPTLYVASQRTKKLLSQPRMVPVLAASAAFSFLIMMLNVPVLGGTTAHAVGAVLDRRDCRALGCRASRSRLPSSSRPSSSVTAGSSRWASTASTWRSSCPIRGMLSTAFSRRRRPALARRRLAAAGIAAYCGLVAAAFLNSIELGIQPLLHTVNGVAQYAPYGLRRRSRLWWAPTP